MQYVPQCAGLTQGRPGGAAQVGDVVLGTVQAVQAYGAFVDMGTGTTGLLHVSQISHDRITQVDKVLSVGDKLKARAQRPPSAHAALRGMHGSGDALAGHGLCVHGPPCPLCMQCMCKGVQLQLELRMIASRYCLLLTGVAEFVHAEKSCLVSWTEVINICGSAGRC